ncbi:MAG: Stp1/IreP family PP2C-type Ser/Thr phosphatase [Bdellovibrionales bacterium]|nr:Stp1/IreP family PP2C-type Ser/Thr phosphatase [Bdellovibrionales bacterium]
MSVETSQSEDDVLGFLSHASGTDIGMRREENQDSFGVLQHDRCHFYVVADGMGGVKGGAVASKLAIEVFTQRLQDIEIPTPEILAEVLREANRQIFDRGNTEPSLAGMGTTFVGIAFFDQKMILMNVGDSRVYRVRGGQIAQLTQDHTLIHELIMSGAISPEQAEDHPVAHMLTRSLGPTPAVEPDCWISPDGPARGDRYLICSDGLYNLVSSDEIASLLAENSLEEAVQKSIALANERGGTDNITVITVEVNDEFPVGPEAFSSTQSSTVDIDSDTLELDAHELNGLNGHAHRSTPKSEESPLISGSVSIDDIHVEIPEPLEGESEEEEPVAEHVGRYNPNWKVLTGILGAAACIVIGAAYVQQGLRAPDREQVAVQNDKQIVEQPVASESTPSTPAREEVSPPKPDFASVESTSEVPSDTMEKPVSQAQELPNTPEITEPSVEIVPPTLSTHKDVESELLSRRKHLTTIAEDLREQIASFDRPLSGNVGGILTESTQRIKNLEDKLIELRAEVDVATRKLAVWYGRRKRIESTDPVNLAAEVAVVSESVRQSKEAFERATWDYLKAAEALRYNPTDSEQKQVVSELTQKRKEFQQHLVLEVRDAIDQEVGVADHRITELALERDKLEEQLVRARQQLDYAKVLMHGDGDQKESKKSELVSELEIVEAELAQLQEIPIMTPPLAE